ncbi:Tetratricopeptide repeat protein 28 [Exaiptasia diaphana]|nr:Tetratricopeptide repeat protein 28 [Exaiptasia diaphana]
MTSCANRELLSNIYNMSGLRQLAQVLKKLLKKIQSDEKIRVKAETKALELADVKTISSHREGCILFYNVHSNKVTYHSWVISSRTPSTFFYDEMDNRDALATILSSLSDDERKHTEAGYFQYLADNCFQQLNVREGKRIKCEDRSMKSLAHEDLECATSTNSSQLSENALKAFQKVDRCILDEEDDDMEPLDMLFYRLVSPVLDQLTHDEVIIIPDGYLFMVPFAALQDPKTGKFLSETKRIRLAPSLTTLKILQQSSHDTYCRYSTVRFPLIRNPLYWEELQTFQSWMTCWSGALIIGNPTTGHVSHNGRTVIFSPLPGAEDEAIQISNLLGVQPLIGSQATKETVLRRLQQGLLRIRYCCQLKQRMHKKVIYFIHDRQRTEG